MLLRRHHLLVPVVIAVCSIGAGIVLSGDASAATPSEDAASQSLRTFSSVYDVVEKNFADAVKPENSIYKGAIPGMLRTLDPHSNFFDPKAFQELREGQRGTYYGVGMQVAQRNGQTVVMAPFPGSPAAKAGIRPGDVIVVVNDKKTEGLNTTEVADLLRGPRGTKVQVQVSREGVDQNLTFNITRDEIPRFSVSGGYMLKPGVAYIKVESFNENTSQEMEDKFKKLGEKNVQGLVLDLRANPGGLLNEGVDVAGHFLKKGELIVFHQGRNSPNKNYAARTDGTGKDYPIVVLVDRYTASAAEIVSGALQDHDRGWILGEGTFGKGLVQTVYPMGDNTGLALTTAHYYTPSGRLIQRDYSNISFLDYYTHSNLEQKNLQDVKTTDSGRTVYGGGGITPDEKYEPAMLNPFQISVRRKDGFFGFSTRFFGKRGDAKLPQGWEPDAAVIDQFKAYLKEKEVTFTDADFTANREWMKQELKREMYITAFSTDESERVKIEQDPMVLKAMDSMPKAKELLSKSKNMLVKRMKAQETVATNVR